MLRCRPSREPRDGQVEAWPKEMHRAAFSNIDRVRPCFVLFPRAECLNADNVDVILACRQYKFVVPHHHVLIIKNQGNQKANL